MSDVPIGVLLSGGLDSSLTSNCSEIIGEQGKTTFIFYRFRCRCSDAVAARKVADFLATEHHEIYFSVEKILDKLIWHLETM
jgi:asparagine synthase (glutamine-hydrolysing)